MTSLLCLLEQDNLFSMDFCIALLGRGKNIKIAECLNMLKIAYFISAYNEVILSSEHRENIS